MEGEEPVTEVPVLIELTKESVRKINELLQYSRYKQYDLEWITNHAVEKYYDKKMDENIYDNYRRGQIRRRLSYQSWMCYWDWCKKPITPDTATLDHLTPLSRGGISEPSNLVVSCETCNGEKGDMTEEEYSKFKLMRPLYEEGVHTS